MPYEERAKHARNPMAKQCFELMARKQSNLCVAADVGSVEEMLLLAEQVGNSACSSDSHTVGACGQAEQQMSTF